MTGARAGGTSTVPVAPRSVSLLLLAVGFAPADTLRYPRPIVCRRNGNKCVVLGSDPTKWSECEPLPPDRSLIEGFRHFDAAVHAAAAGDIQSARAKLVAVESDAIRSWFIEHAQVAGNARVAALGRAAPAPYVGPVDELAYPRSATVLEVFRADGYRCRYCQRPVVHKGVLTLVQRIVGKSIFSMGLTNLEMHGAAIAHRAVVDHLVPRKRGGPTKLGNLVTACYPCNFGKAHYTLEQLGLCAPRAALRDEWDGLQSLVPALKTHARAASTPVPR